MLTESAGPAIAAAYGLGADAVLTGPVARGEQGRVWRLETASGRYAVKDPFGPVDADAAQADGDYQDVVRATGVTMPRVLRSIEGRVLVDIGDSPARVYEWLDLLPHERRLDPAAVGRLLARIHRVVVPGDQPMPGWYVDPVGEDRWRDLVDRLGAAEAPFAADLAAVVPRIVAVEALMRPVRATQWCHLDLFSNNVLRTPSGDLAVLDWENSGPGNPTQELGMVLVELGLEEPARIAELHTAYVDAGGPGLIAGPGDLTVAAAQLGHIGVMGCERWLASDSDAERAGNEAWVREFVDEPVTLRTVETIVAAVSSPRRP